MRQRLCWVAGWVLVPWITGCAVHSVKEWDRPEVEVPQAYVEGHSGEVAVNEWWKEFNDEGLDKAMAMAQVGNLELKQAWARIQQALYQARIVGADQFPELDMQLGSSRTWWDTDGSAAVGAGGLGNGLGGNQARGFAPGGTSIINRVFLTFGLRYEVDLWQRIASQARAATLTYQATRQDFEATALSLSGLIFDAWTQAKEQRALLVLLQEQLLISHQLLELTELRFSQGQGTAVDVLQQRQQVAATRTDIPRAEAGLATAMNQLAVLVGKPPGTLEALIPGGRLGGLPPFPRLGTPADLFKGRPDLRAAMLRLRASDHEVASAVANMLPRVTLDLSYEFRAVDPLTLFNQQIGTIAGNALQPLFDAGRRLNEIERRKAILQEQLSFFGQVYLEALQEVEDALVQEKHQVELIQRLEAQENWATATLLESRSRYSHGLSAYTDVLIAVQSQQEVQRRLVSERRRLLVFRSQLYRALGGRWTSELGEPRSSMKLSMAKKCQASLLVEYSL